MIKVLFFAQTRELVGTESLILETPFETAEQIRQHLAKQSDKWALALDSEKLLVAINQTISPLSAQIKQGDEVAFFPPVTGG